MPGPLQALSGGLTRFLFQAPRDGPVILYHVLRFTDEGTETHRRFKTCPSCCGWEVGGGRLAAGLPGSPACNLAGCPGRGGAGGGWGEWCSLPRLSDQLLCAERTLQGVDSARNILVEVRRATTSQRQGPIPQQVTGAGFAQGRGQAKCATVGPTSPALAST